MPARKKAALLGRRTRQMACLITRIREKLLAHAAFSRCRASRSIPCRTSLACNLTRSKEAVPWVQAVCKVIRLARGCSPPIGKERLAVQELRSDVFPADRKMQAAQRIVSGRTRKLGW